MTKARTKTGFEDMIERAMRDIEEEYRDEGPPDTPPAKPRRKAGSTENRSSLLDIEEAAAYLRVSVRTVARLLRNKQLTKSYVRGQLRFEKIHLDRYLQKRTVAAL